MKNDIIWPLFLPAVLAKHSDEAASTSPISCALHYLRSHAEALPSFDSVRNLDDMQKPGLWIKQWSMGIECLLTEQKSLSSFDVKELLQ
ncbi:hypothetical protein FJ365_04490 [Candidatus Dependentiae bacterium]|nr:hypothetical protein [Candidatus Dependentiae bacterium]